MTDVKRSVGVTEGDLEGFGADISASRLILVAVFRLRGVGVCPVETPPLLLRTLCSLAL